MNYLTIIIRLLEAPEQSFFNDGTTVTEVRAEFYSSPFLPKNDTIIILTAWDEIAHDLATNYHKGDYLLVEGGLNVREELFDTSIPAVYNKDFEIIISNLSPILFQPTSTRFSYLFE